MGGGASKARKAAEAQRIEELLEDTKNKEESIVDHSKQIEDAKKELVVSKENIFTQKVEVETCRKEVEVAEVETAAIVGSSEKAAADAKAKLEAEREALLAKVAAAEEAKRKAEGDKVAQLERRNSSESAFKAAATKLTNIKSAVAHLEERIKFNVAKAIEHRELAESYKQQAFDGMGGVASGTGWAADNEPNDPMAAQSSSGSGGAFSRPPERRRTIVLDLDELQRSQQLPVWFTTPITASVEATGSAEDGSR